MTTIAYKDGLIATDGLATNNGTIISDNATKQFKRDGVQFYNSGSTADDALFLDVFFGGNTSYDLNIGSIVVEGDNLLYCGYDKDDKRIWRCPLDKSESFAIGSGSDHALTAMDMGATAREALEFAARRDTCTGGTIRVYDIKTGEEVAE